MTKILLSQTAYEQLLIHMLQFASKNLKKSDEVMGLLYGVRSGESIEIRKTVPIKHGPSCEKPFTETDFVAFNESDKKIIPEGFEPLGFYSTHPKMGFYLSQNEIRNLIYFIQERKIPYAICLVGDHLKLDEKDNYGWQANCLKDPAKGTSSDSISLSIEIEKLKDMSLFKTTKYLIEQAQKRQPYVEEQGSQLSVDDSVWDAFGDGESEGEKVRKKIAPILDIMRPEIGNIDQSFISGGIKAFNTFLDEISQFTGKTFNDPSNDLVAMRSSIEDGLKNVVDWFKTTLKMQSNKIQQDFARTLTTIDEGQQSNVNAMKILLINQLRTYQQLINELKK
jgi:proteasome lid subunit RPN8/RPN11